MKIYWHQKKGGVFLYYYHFTPYKFFTLAGGLSLESEWQQVSSGLQDSSQYSGWSQQCFSLDDLDSLSDFQFLQSLSKPLGTISSIPTITVILMFHSFFSSLARSKYLSIFPFSFIFTLLSVWMVKFIQWQILFFLLIIARSAHLVGIRWCVCISKSQRILYILFSDSGLCIYHLVVWSNFSLLHNSQWIIFSNQLNLVLYSFCASLLHSLIMWLNISLLSPYNIHLLFYCILLIFVLILLIFMALFCAAIRRGSVSF